ncbi:PfkB family carbohydrate kinase [Nocardioides zeae]|uniref:Ribokinase n=1 Tax=Nocardioides zeae TaxID=1457234 RepID=A0AAJ1U7Y1_9ACTN|nr:PfkB family carbohydrate kinase [Nocardioides zeae]MDQ1106061.1 ribokinase [Nocardioides zeae]
MTTSAPPSVPLVTVVGSLNVDRVVDVARLPEPGATVIGTTRSRIGPGGKGANQAAAAATFAGAPGAVAMVGAVGEDSGADLSLDDLRERGVDVAGVRRVPGVATGHATVALDAERQNLIVVDPGANAELGVDDVATDAVRDAAVVLLQLEVPTATVVAAAAHARGTVVLNPAPPPTADERDALLAHADVLVPNRGELAAMLDRPEATDVDAVVEQVRALPFSGTLVVTLGGDGALVVDGERVEHVVAPVVRPVDTTGAGDCFCGVLAVGLARGVELVAAVRAAAAGASCSVTGAGARGRLPVEADTVSPA